MNTSNNSHLPSFQRARIDVLMAYLGSVSVYETLKDEPRLLKYILEHHLDEELEMHLHDTMGYDPTIHRLFVSHDGTISF